MNPNSTGGKKKLFGGMKIKGPSVKAQQAAAKSSNNTIPQTIIKNVATTSDNKQHQQSTYSSTAVSMSKTNSGSESLTKQNLVKQAQQASNNSKEQSNQQKKQSKQGTGSRSRTGSQSSKSNKSKQESIQSFQKANNNKQNLVTKNQFKKTRSEHNYNLNKAVQIQQDQAAQNIDLKQDKSQNAAGKSDQFRKRKSTAGVAPKDNPLLSQLKKSTTVNSRPKKSYDQAETQGTPSNQLANSAIGRSDKTQKQKQTVLKEISESHERILQNLIKKKQAKEQLTELREKQSVATNKQNHYIATEEYEMADKLQQELQTLKEKIEEEQIQLSCIQEAFYKMQYDFLDILKTHYSQQKRVIRKIKLVQLELEDDLAQFKRRQDAIIENQKVLNNNEKKKIGRIDSDIQNQQQQLDQYEKTFYEDLNARRKPLEGTLKEEEAKKKILKQQIKQLELKLAAKKAALKTTVSTIQSIELKIQDVDNTFEEEKVKLDERKSNLDQLKGQRKDMNKKLQEMEQNVKSLERQKLTQQKNILKQKQLLKSLTAKLQKSCASSESDDLIENKKVKIDNFIHSSKELREFEEKHKQKRQKLSQLEFKKSNVLSQVSKNEDRIKQLKSRIPKLQQEQKQMSMSKNFKGAAMKKAQIKQCTEEIAEVKKSIQASFAEQAQIDFEIGEMMKLQQEYTEEQNQIRKNLAVNQYKLARQKIAQLQSQIEWIGELQTSNEELKTKYLSALQEEINSISQQADYIAEEYQLAKKSNSSSPEKKKAEGNASTKKSRQSQTSNISRQKSKQEQSKLSSKKSPSEQKIQQQTPSNAAGVSQSNQQSKRKPTTNCKKKDSQDSEKNQQQKLQSKDDRYEPPFPESDQQDKENDSNKADDYQEEQADHHRKTKQNEQVNKKNTILSNNEKENISSQQKKSHKIETKQEAIVNDNQVENQDQKLQNQSQDNQVKGTDNDKATDDNNNNDDGNGYVPLQLD